MTLSEKTLKQCSTDDKLNIAFNLIQSEHPLLAHAFYTHRTHDGKRLDFTKNLWQIPFLRDTSQIKVIKKSSQCGATLLEGNEVFYLAEKGYSGLYILPTDQWKNTFVPNRIDKTIEVVPDYRANCLTKRKDADNKTMKTLYGRNWKFVGSKQRNNFYEFPAGAIFIDEYDLCDQDNLGYAFDRLGAEANPIIRKFGNPSISGKGIDEEYELSDQKSWFVACPHCNTKQILDWFINFVKQEDDGSWVLRDKRGLCNTCDKPLTRLSKGEWVSKYPDRSVSGYHVSKLFADSRESVNGVDPMEHLFAVYLKALNNPTELQRFYNNDLGIAYDAPGSKITPDILRACQVDYSMDSMDRSIPSVAGVDVGSVLHVNISQIVDGKRRKVFVGTVRDFEALSFLVKQYNIRCGVIDAMPETHAVKGFLKQHPGWYMCQYHKSDKVNDYKIDHITKIIQIDRTQALDASFQAYLDKAVELPRDWRSLDGGDFLKQMTAPTRVYDTDKDRYVWDEGSKADHHRHGDTYEMLSDRIYGGGGSLVTVI